ncbi:MAG TPA: valine--tRNA ligase [Polyangiaceae bacterium]|jgi:valyl-tRNA synthetase|nr:valine--tRNA ligase [Polyangiaceae bacterium]
MSTSELPKSYEPAEVEGRWFAFWAEHGIFRASLSADDGRKTYVVAMPPPNVTGSLHMGHAMFGTIQDVLVRHKRMQGFNVLWQPGVDHAGIATQTVVERQLKREGKTRHDLGREAFLARVWAWKEKSGGRIVEQMKVLGCSADWDRLKFTLDSDMQRAVREAFVRLYEDGLIYRATRLVNWDVAAQTVLSDLEVEVEENVQGELYEFAYPVVGAAPDRGATELVIATTRPETMLGDAAVAVHPDDPRYSHLHGKKVRHPFSGRELPIITDAILVDPKFGTGVVKVTPAHDFNDFATGKRHGLAELNIMNLDGTINEAGGEFAGLDRFVARKEVKKRLSALGLERGSKVHQMTLPRSQRSGTIVEPIISTQWFVKMKPLAEPALAAVKGGRTTFLPEDWVKTYNHWLENIEDWCISRQLWWGHRIPAFHCTKCGHVAVSREESVTRCEKCGSDVTQDADVLDTWFSSGLWPFSTMGWPEKTVALERFYPSDDMSTGYDIIFFWVARMMMMGLYFMGEVPFRRVLLNGLVVDETGEKMSKTKANSIDPLDLVHGSDFDSVVQKALPDAPIAEALTKFKRAYPSVAQLGKGFPAYGADAVRLTLSSYSPQARRIALSPKRIEGYRHFCNKIYNAVRFALGNVEGAALSPSGPPKATLLYNRWILSRLATAVEAATAGIDDFRLDEGSSALYHFFWDELCSWYLELTKPVFAGGTEEERRETRDTLAHAIETALRALHPFIPFVTEELWQRVPRPAGHPISIALAPYPTRADGAVDATAEADMAHLMHAIGAARTIRSEHDVPPSGKVKLHLRSADAALRALLERESRAIAALVRTDGEPVVEAPAPRPRGSVLSVAGNVEVLVELRGLVQPEKEAERIERTLKKLDKDLAGLKKRLADPKFTSNAPAEVVKAAEEQKSSLERQQARLEEERGLVEELKE